MAAWIAIGLSAAVYVITISVVWGRMSERADGLEGRVVKLEDNSQTAGEREALALVVRTELTGHAKEDTVRFGSIEDRMDIMAAGLEKKLDRILELVALTHKK